jgi:hypothetical protein
MTCDGRHVQALRNVMAKIAAAQTARQEIQKADELLSVAILRWDHEQAEAKRAIELCSVCSAQWALSP